MHVVYTQLEQVHDAIIGEWRHSNDIDQYHRIGDVIGRCMYYSLKPMILNFPK